MKLQFLKYHGGKGRMCNKIIPLIPEHYVYVEPFLGGGSILLNKSPALSIVKDINKKLIDLWLYLKSGELIKEVKGIEYTRENFERAKQNYFSPSLNEFILYRMSRGGLKKDFAWSERLRGGIPGDVNAWNNAVKNLPHIQEKIKDTIFLHGDWENITNYSDHDVFVFLDPPYTHNERSKTFYENEIDEAAHIKILSYFSSSRSKIMLCGYENELYNSTIGKPSFKFDVPNNSSQSKIKKRKVECLWTNY